MFFPGAYHLLILTEHPFPGTRRIDQDLVKITAEIAFQSSRFFTHDQHIADSENFQIL